MADAAVSAAPARSTRVAFVGAVVAATVPIATAAARGVASGWQPTGDNAYVAVRAHDVFSAHPPLLGTWSSASLYTGRPINHPGPLQFDLLAIPVRLAGYRAGTAIGMALINIVAVVLLGWLAARLLGHGMAAVAMAFSALLAWSMGSEVLYDIWGLHAPLLPFALFLVATWAVLADDLVAVPVLVVSGSYVLQTHLSYVVLVPALAAVAIGTMVVRLVTSRRRTGRAERRRRLGWLYLGLYLGLLCWLQPLVQQLTAPGLGNMNALWLSRNADAPNLGASAALRILGGTVAVPPAWLPPSFGRPSFHLDGSGRPTWLAGLALGALAVALVVLGRRAWQRGSSAIAAGIVLAFGALPLGYLTVLFSPMRWGAAPTYVRWMWPLGMVVWLALASALVDELRGWRPQQKVGRLALVVAVVAAGGASIRTVDNDSGSPPWTTEAARTLSADVVAAVDDRDVVLVRLSVDTTSGAVGPALFTALEDAGVEFYVDDPAVVRQLGEARRYEPGTAEAMVVVRGDVLAESKGDDERLVASWHGVSAADSTERRVMVYVRTFPARERSTDHGGR